MPFVLEAEDVRKHVDGQARRNHGGTTSLDPFVASRQPVPEQSLQFFDMRTYMLGGHRLNVIGDVRRQRAPIFICLRHSRHRRQPGETSLKVDSQWTGPADEPEPIVAEKYGRASGPLLLQRKDERSEGALFPIAIHPIAVQYCQHRVHEHCLFPYSHPVYLHNNVAGLVSARRTCSIRLVSIKWGNAGREDRWPSNQSARFSPTLTSRRTRIICQTTGAK